MTRLSINEVQHIATLSRLKLTSLEVDKFQKELSEIVEYVSHLSEIDTSKEEPTSQTTGLENIVRKDETGTEILKQNEALSGKDNTCNGYFFVDSILNK